MNMVPWHGQAANKETERHLGLVNPHPASSGIQLAVGVVCVLGAFEGAKEGEGWMRGVGFEPTNP